MANAGNALRGLGVQQDQINAVVDAIDPGQLVDLAMSVLSSTLGVLSNLFFLLTVLLFMAFDTDSTRRGLAMLRDRFPNPVGALDNFALGTRNYMGVSASFGLIVAVLDGLALWIMGVPGAFVWAVLAFVTNFIPNIGFIIGVIPPALIALLDGGPGLMIAVIVVYSVINFLIQSVIQPRVVGDAVGLTPTLTFMSLVFWTWVIGPLGALLAVPLSLLTKALLVEADPRTAVGAATDLRQDGPARQAGAASEPTGRARAATEAPRRCPGWTGAITCGRREQPTGPVVTDADRHTGGESAEGEAKARAEAALNRLPPRLRAAIAWLLSRWPGRIAVAGARVSLRVDIFDRSMTIAAQTFSSIFPILILFATWADAGGTNEVANAVDMPRSPGRFSTMRSAEPTAPRSVSSAR